MEKVSRISIDSNISNKKVLWKRIVSYKYFYFMLVPVFVWYVIFCYAPIYGLVMAFQNFSMAQGFFKSPFVGLTHFIRLFNDEYFFRAFWNTTILAIYRVVFCCTFEIVVALLLNELRSKHFRKSVQTIIYLPHFLSWVIVASVFLTVMSPESGLIGPLFELFGKEAPSLLIDPSKFRMILITTAMWKEAGFGTIIYIAAIAGIDPCTYEAAWIDGANRWKQLLYVTLPGIRATIVVMIVLNIGRSLTWGFDQVYNLYNPLVYATGDILDTYIVRTAMVDNRFSYAAAAGLFRSVICLTLLLLTNKASKKISGQGMY